jgi:hypothetical protein
MLQPGPQPQPTGTTAPASDAAGTGAIGRAPADPVAARLAPNSAAARVRILNIDFIFGSFKLRMKTSHPQTERRLNFSVAAGWREKVFLLL